MNVAWIHDTKPHGGGAELAMKMLEDARPLHIVLKRAQPGVITTGSVDLVLLHNITEFGPDLHGYLAAQRAKGTRCVKYVHDLWQHGSDALREFCLRECELIFTSPYHLDKFKEEHQVPAQIQGIVPPPIDLSRIAATREFSNRPEDVCFVGRLFEGKGVFNMRNWSLKTGRKIDVYGTGPDIRTVMREPECFNVMGHTHPDTVPEILSRYQHFIFLPDWPEPCGRAVLEAHAAGCSLILNENVGARWYLDKFSLVENATRDYWSHALRDSA